MKTLMKDVTVDNLIISGEIHCDASQFIIRNCGIKNSTRNIALSVDNEGNFVLKGKLIFGTTDVYCLDGSVQINGLG